MSNQGIITLKEKMKKKRENDRRARTFIWVSFLPGQEDKRKGQEVVKVVMRWSQTKGQNNPKRSVSVHPRQHQEQERPGSRVSKNGLPWTSWSLSPRYEGLETSVVLSKSLLLSFLKSSELRTAKAESYCSCSVHHCFLLDQLPQPQNREQVDNTS